MGNHHHLAFPIPPALYFFLTCFTPAFIHCGCLAFVQHMYNVVVVRNGTVFFVHILFESSSREFQGVLWKKMVRDGGRWRDAMYTWKLFLPSLLPPTTFNLCSNDRPMCVLQNNQKPSIPKIYVRTYIHNGRRRRRRGKSGRDLYRCIATTMEKTLSILYSSNEKSSKGKGITCTLWWYNSICFHWASIWVHKSLFVQFSFWTWARRDFLCSCIPLIRGIIKFTSTFDERIQ